MRVKHGSHTESRQSRAPVTALALNTDRLVVVSPPSEHKQFLKTHTGVVSVGPVSPLCLTTLSLPCYIWCLNLGTESSSRSCLCSISLPLPLCYIRGHATHTPSGSQLALLPGSFLYPLTLSLVVLLSHMVPKGPWAIAHRWLAKTTWRDEGWE